MTDLVKPNKKKSFFNKRLEMRFYPHFTEIIVSNYAILVLEDNRFISFFYTLMDGDISGMTLDKSESVKKDNLLISFLIFHPYRDDSKDNSNKRVRLIFKENGCGMNDYSIST